MPARSRTVNVRVCDPERDETVREGRAIDLWAFDLRAKTVARAVRGGSDPDRPLAEDSRPRGDSRLVVDCPDPGPAHEHVGAITTKADLSRRAALAAAARSRGHTAPEDEEIAAVQERLDALDPPTVDLRAARERVADASDAAAEWRERVATLQGRVRALREADADPGDAEADLDEATRRLSEIETERIAAEQALARARERAHEHRETRRERLRLEDRVGNLRRVAREHLAGRLADEFESARDEVPDDTLESGVADALAVARVADLDAPVVLARDVAPFGSPEAAAEWLDASVLFV